MAVRDGQKPTVVPCNLRTDDSGVVSTFEERSCVGPRIKVDGIRSRYQ